MLIQFPLPVLRSRGWNYAEVTAGGIPLHEINVSTMESRKCSGLYLVGEMLDCDGRIGGFNLQWAWSTGFIAGTSACSSGPSREFVCMLKEKKRNFVADLFVTNSWLYRSNGNHVQSHAGTSCACTLHGLQHRILFPVLGDVLGSAITKIA